MKDRKSNLESSKHYFKHHKRLKRFFPFILLLIISLSQNIFSKQYKGAEYRSKNSYLYGRFEVRMKSFQKSGALSTFFTYHDTPNADQWNEIDVEILGRYNNEVQFNAITPYQTNHKRHEFLDFNPSMGYHTYAFEWTPDYVAYFVDDKEVYRQTDDFIKTLIHAQKIMMNVWIPAWDNWTGHWYENEAPAFASYDWIKYSAYTPDSGSYGTNDNFTPAWTDSLNNFDSNIWEKGDHTFPSNEVDFIPENIVFRNGKMILCITKYTNIGYTDVNPPYVLWARQKGNIVNAEFSEKIDKTSAETASNYIIPGITVDSVRLLTDKQSINIYTTNFDTSKTNTLVVNNVKDLFEPPNKMSYKGTTIINDKPLDFPVKINVGGDTTGDFLRDQEWGPKAQYGYLEGDSTYYESININNTNEQEVFRFERHNIAAYRIRVGKGLYKLTLLFAENYFDQSGKRIFDVFVEDSNLVLNYDIFKSAGAKNATELIFNDVNVSDGVLDINFSARKDLPELNGIILNKLATSVKKNYNPSERSFILEQNYPNPFNPNTTISYYLPRASRVSLIVYNSLGQKVKQIVNNFEEPGNHKINFDAENLSSGIYFYKISAGNSAQVRKMLLLK